MNWTPLTDMDQLDAIEAASFHIPQVLFKHSTRCNISADAYDEMSLAAADAWYLDLLRFRTISDEIAARYGVLHKSPQVLIISNGICVYHESHWRIKSDTVLAHIQNCLNHVAIG